MQLKVGETTYAWFVFVHLVGVTGFLLAHGVAVGVALKIHSERSPDRVRALLELSRVSNLFMYAATVPLLAGGIFAGFDGGWWDEGWIWTSIGVFVGMTAGALVVARPYYRRVRAALVQRPASADELVRLLNAPQPLAIAAMGLAGLGVILWLMVLKPF